MRQAMLLLAAVGALGWIACIVDGSEPDVIAISGWRYTAQGWSRCDGWNRIDPRPIALPHPVVLGLLQLLGSALALYAFAPGDHANRPTTVWHWLHPC